MGKHHTATFKAHLVRELRREAKTSNEFAADSQALAEPRTASARLAEP